MIVCVEGHPRMDDFTFCFTTSSLSALNFATFGLCLMLLLVQKTKLYKSGTTQKKKSFCWPDNVQETKGVKPVCWLGKQAEGNKTNMAMGSGLKSVNVNLVFVRIQICKKILSKSGVDWCVRCSQGQSIHRWHTCRGSLRGNLRGKLRWRSGENRFRRFDRVGRKI